MVQSVFCKLSTSESTYFWTDEILFLEFHPIAWRVVHYQAARKLSAALDPPVLASEAIRCLIVWHNKQVDRLQGLAKIDCYQELKRVCITISKRKVFRAVEKANRKKRIAEHEFSLNGFEQSIEDPNPCPYQLAVYQEQIDLVLKALQELDQILFEYIYLGWSNREISDILDIPIRQIQRRRNNIFSILRDHFREATLKSDPATSNKQQATSNKQQATSNKQKTSLVWWMVESIRKRIFFLTSYKECRALV